MHRSASQLCLSGSWNRCTMGVKHTMLHPTAQLLRTWRILYMHTVALAQSWPARGLRKHITSCKRMHSRSIYAQVVTPWDVAGGTDGKIDYGKLIADVSFRAAMKLAGMLRWHALLSVQ